MNNTEIKIPYTEDNKFMWLLNRYNTEKCDNCIFFEAIHILATTSDNMVKLKTLELLHNLQY